MYLKAIEIAPNYPNSYSNLALLYEGQKDYANALLYWIKRSTLGNPEDPWTEIARKRLEDILRLTPEAYNKVRQQYKENLPPQKGLSNEDTTFNIDTNKIAALIYLARAKENFSKGDYISALKEATIAEYLDSSNAEISAFINKISKAMLH